MTAALLDRLAKAGEDGYDVCDLALRRAVIVLVVLVSGLFSTRVRRWLRRWAVESAVRYYHCKINCDWYLLDRPVFGPKVQELRARWKATSDWYDRIRARCGLKDGQGPDEVT